MQNILKTFVVVAIMLLSSTTLCSQAENVFTVRIGNFLSPQAADFEDLQPIGFLFADSLASNLYMISMGMYSLRAEAESVEAAIKQKGFPDADVEMLPVRKGRKEPVIQLATLDPTKPVRWAEIFKAYSNISVSLIDNRLIVLATGFQNQAEASQALTAIKKAGFSGAFPKSYESSKLIKVTEFETGGFKIPKPAASAPIVETKPAPTPIPVAVTEPEPTPAPKIEIIEPAPTPEPEISKPVEHTTTTKKSVALPSRRVAYPKIDGKIKRNSAIELQRILKAEKNYSGSLDGFYGPGTTKGFDNFKSKNRQWKKYVLLADLWKTGSGSENVSAFQQAIFDAYETPSKSNVIFEKNKSPLATAYRAFNDFRKSGPSKSVNDKMNAAIKRSFPSKKLGNTKPFDYSATYSYQDNEQLIRHLKYLHMASEEDVTIPCWIFDVFPKESIKIFGESSAKLKMQDCTGVSDWDEVKVLKTLASDISLDVNNKKLERASAQKAQLLLSPANLTKVGKANVEKWNSTLMGNLAGWATRDPMHAELVTVFKVAYFQSQVRLESYFIDNGIKPDEARSLAIATLKTLIGEQMSRFTN